MNLWQLTFSIYSDFPRCLLKINFPGDSQQWLICQVYALLIQLSVTLTGSHQRWALVINGNLRLRVWAEEPLLTFNCRRPWYTYEQKTTKSSLIERWFTCRDKTAEIARNATCDDIEPALPSKAFYVFAKFNECWLVPRTSKLVLPTLHGDFCRRRSRAARVKRNAKMTSHRKIIHEPLREVLTITASVTHLLKSSTHNRSRNFTSEPKLVLIVTTPPIVNMSDFIVSSTFTLHNDVSLPGDSPADKQTRSFYSYLHSEMIFLFFDFRWIKSSAVKFNALLSPKLCLKKNPSDENKAVGGFIEVHETFSLSIMNWIFTLLITWSGFRLSWGKFFVDRLFIESIFHESLRISREFLYQIKLILFEKSSWEGQKVLLVVSMTKSLSTSSLFIDQFHTWRWINEKPKKLRRGYPAGCEDWSVTRGNWGRVCWVNERLIGDWVVVNDRKYFMNKTSDEDFNLIASNDEISPKTIRLASLIKNSPIYGQQSNILNQHASLGSCLTTLIHDVFSHRLIAK